MPEIPAGIDGGMSGYFAKLAQILEEKVLEIWEGENGDYYAAYLMNDSAESFLVFPMLI